MWCSKMVCFYLSLLIFNPDMTHQYVIYLSQSFRVDSVSERPLQLDGVWDVDVMEPQQGFAIQCLLSVD